MNNTARKLIFLLLIILLEAVQPAQAYANVAYLDRDQQTPSAPTNVIQTIAHNPANAAVSGLSLDDSSQDSARAKTKITVEKLEKKAYTANENISVTVNNPDEQKLDTKVVDVEGRELGVTVEESTIGTQNQITVAPTSQFKPGKYTLEIQDPEKNTSKQDFTWGVLAINPDKAVYAPNENAALSFAVLDDKGDMVCSANVTLDITTPEGKIDTLSTDNGKIIKNDVCDKKEFTLKPDFQSSYHLGNVGDYQLKLTATTSNGTNTIDDRIQVKSDEPFTITRTSATRLFPPLHYPMNIEITANKDFDGVVTETVPASFEISPGVDAGSYDNLQTIYLDQNNPEQQLHNQVLGTSTSVLAMPFDGDYPITQGFGNPMTDGKLQSFYSQFGLAGHDGIDFGLPMGTPLYAVDDGTILLAGPGDYGITIVIQHSWGRSYYGHLSKVNVQQGDHVSKGSLLGYSGNTGESTGPHLHFGMKPNNADTHNGYGGKVNPLDYLPIGTHKLLDVTSLPLTNVLGASSAAQIAPTSAATTSAAPIASSAAQPTPIATSSASLVISTASSSASEAFEVSDQRIGTDALQTTDDPKVKVLKWKVSMKKGETKTLRYVFKSPPLSPQFYLLGPVTFYNGTSTDIVYKEPRQWQLAADAVPTQVLFMDSGSDYAKGTSNTTSANYLYSNIFNYARTSTDQVHSGLRSIHFDTQGTAVSALLHTEPGTVGNNVRWSYWLYFNAFPSTGSWSMMQLYQSDDTTYVGEMLTMDAAHHILLAEQSQTSSTTLTTGKWYHIVVDWTFTSATVNAAKLYINENLEASSSNVTFTNFNPSLARFGFVSGTWVANAAMYVDDIYVDDGSNLDNPGAIRVANKRPFANGAANTWTVSGSAGGYGSGNARYVNEQFPSSTNLLSTSTAGASENYDVEGPAVGDQDITGTRIVAYQAWFDSASTGTCTNPKLTLNGTSTNFTSTGFENDYYISSITSDYPSNTAKIGMVSCASGGGTLQLMEAGLHIAYLPGRLEDLMRHGQYFDQNGNGGATTIQPFSW